MRFTKILILLLTLSFTTGLMNCSKQSHQSLKIGVLLPLTGSKAKFGEMEKNSFELALRKINSQRRQQGEDTLVFVYEDDTGKPEVGRAAAEKLIGR